MLLFTKLWWRNWYSATWLKQIDNNSKTEGTCKDCGKKIQFIPPTKFNIWYKKEKEINYNYAPPKDNPVGSIIDVWVEGVNGDKDYSEIIFEVSDTKLLKLPSKIKNEPNQLEVIGVGEVEVTCYAKYNPSLKRKFNIKLG